MIMISDHEKIFGGIFSDQVLNILIMSVKDVIYQKRKVGKEMTIFDVKKCLQKNLSILKSKIYCQMAMVSLTIDGTRLYKT